MVADSKTLEALSETKETGEDTAVEDISEALSETKEAGEDRAVEDIESQGYQDSGRGSDQSRKSSEQFIND